MVIKKLWNTLSKNTTNNTVVEQEQLAPVTVRTEYKTLPRDVQGYKLTESQFLGYLEHPQFPKETLPTYQPVIVRMALVRNAFLTPVIVWTDDNLIYVTSQEYLEGKFN